MEYIFNAEIRFVFAILFILVQGADGVELRHPRGEHYINSADLPEICHHHIFNLHENGSEARFPIFVLLYRKEGYAGYGNEEEKMYLECEYCHRKFAPGCRR